MVWRDLSRRELLDKTKELSSRKDFFGDFDYFVMCILGEKKKNERKINSIFISFLFQLTASVSRTLTW